MKTLWLKISGVGISDDLDIQQKKKITLTNQMAITLSVIAFSYVIMFYFLVSKELGIYTLIPAILYLLSIPLNFYKKYVLKVI